MTRSTTGILQGSSGPGERNIRRKKQKLMAGVLQGLEALAISNRHISFYAIPNSRRPGVRGFQNTYIGGEKRAGAQVTSVPRLVPFYTSAAKLPSKG
jgi:hypothetical protein